MEKRLVCRNDAANDLKLSEAAMLKQPMTEAAMLKQSQRYVRLP